MTRILYVEDHPPAAMLMTAIVEDLTDYEIVVAESGAEAAKAIGIQKPNLYILDMDLPDTDGMTLAAALQAVHDAPVILVSAYAEAIQTGKLKQYLYLAKPLDPEHVVETIRRALS